MADNFCPANPHAAGATEGVHEGVTCDKSGVCPIVGARYHLVGHDYDLCEAEFAKLSDKEKALFHKIPPPYVHPIPNDDAAAHANTNGGNTNGGDTTTPAPGVHPGVECDRSGMCPIIGTRFHLRGHNYDLCQAEFDKLPAAEKLLYEAIAPPAYMKMPAGGGCPWRAGPGGWGPRGGAGTGGPWAAPKLAARF